MEKFWFISVLISGVVFCFLGVSGTLAQEGTPSATPNIPPSSANPIFETPLPTPATPVPVPSIFVPTPVPVPSVEIIMPPVITVPISTPIPEITPRPTLPIYFEIIRTPSPSATPLQGNNTEENNSPYRRIVVPALSLVTQTNAEEFYRDQALSKRTADLLLFLALIITSIGVYLSFEENIKSGIRKLKEKEYVQYIQR